MKASIAILAAVALFAPFASAQRQDFNGGRTLNEAVIQRIDPNPVEDGQARSLVSNNNFIDFCLGKRLSNGEQVQGGSCNPTPMGDIPSTGRMVSSKFTFPANLGNVDANKAFTIKMAIRNLKTGSFTNPAKTYYAAPQHLDEQGQIIGHSHFVIEQVNSLTSTEVLDPTKFKFFKGVNSPAVNGVLSVEVTDGLPAGTYRLASINAASNHQPVLLAVAQHGSVDDIVYFTVGGNQNQGRGNNNGGGRGNNNGGGRGNSNKRCRRKREVRFGNPEFEDM